MRSIAASIAALVIAACSPELDASVGGDRDAPDVAMTAAPVPLRDADIHHYLLQEFPEAGAIQYALAWTDLNNDGPEEAIIYPFGPFFCGSGGCNTLILSPAGSMYEKVADITVSRTPITVLETTSNGWNDITVFVSGGGTPSGNVLLKYDGKTYPSNPTVAPAELTDEVGVEVLGREPTLRLAEPVTDVSG